MTDCLFGRPEFARGPFRSLSRGGPCLPAPQERLPAVPVLVSAALLLWPAVWNGYPLVFDDTGTYLSQAVHRYLGWDRPPFYSLFLFSLHLTVTTWADIIGQALLTAYTLHLVRSVLMPTASAWWLVGVIAGLSATTALPWFVSQLMPDLFTPLLVLALSLLLFVPERLSAAQRLWTVLFSAFMIAAQHTSVGIACSVLLVLTPLRRWLGAAAPISASGLASLAAPPLVAMTALVSVNAVGFGRVSPFPFDNVFVLARVIYDGPGMNALRRDCPQSGWRLCPFLAFFPGTSDQFLWRPDSPVMLAGGHKRVSEDADAIISAALRAEFGTEVRAWLRNGLVQLGRFDSGDELHPCPGTVTPWIQRDFPRFESAAYAAARQTSRSLTTPGWFQALHRTVAVSGVAGCAIVLAAGIYRQHCAAGFAAAALLAILANAFIAGGLSTPHDRYGSRIMLLAPAVAVVAGASLRSAPMPTEQTRKGDGGTKAAAAGTG